MPRPASDAPLSLAEHACLVLVRQGDSEHGYAVGTLLAPDGDLGRIWTLSRPLTYRAIEALVERRLVARRGTGAGRGRDRSLLRATAAGRRLADAWLERPVEHLRDVRTELLLKLSLRQRAGLDLAPLLLAQQRAFAPAIESLTSVQASSDVVDVWRRESARAVKRFLDEALHPGRAAQGSAGARPIRLSARNQLHGTVVGITHGDVMSTVQIALPDGQPLTAAITNDAVDELDVVPGDPVVAIVKSTEVMIATPDDT